MCVARDKRSEALPSQGGFADLKRRQGVWGLAPSVDR